MVRIVSGCGTDTGKIHIHTRISSDPGLHVTQPLVIRYEGLYDVKPGMGDYSIRATPDGGKNRER